MHFRIILISSILFLAGVLNSCTSDSGNTASHEVGVDTISLQLPNANYLQSCMFCKLYTSGKLSCNCLILPANWKYKNSSIPDAKSCTSISNELGILTCNKEKGAEPVELLPAASIMKVPNSLYIDSCKGCNRNGESLNTLSCNQCLTGNDDVTGPITSLKNYSQWTKIVVNDHGVLKGDSTEGTKPALFTPSAKWSICIKGGKTICTNRENCDDGGGIWKSCATCTNANKQPSENGPGCESN